MYSNYTVHIDLERMKEKKKRDDAIVFLLNSFITQTQTSSSS